jgi:hypothetical protein
MMPAKYLASVPSGNEAKATHWEPTGPSDCANFPLRRKLWASLPQREV